MSIEWVYFEEIRFPALELEAGIKNTSVSPVVLI